MFSVITTGCTVLFFYWIASMFRLFANFISVSEFSDRVKGSKTKAFTEKPPIMYFWSNACPPN